MPPDLRHVCQRLTARHCYEIARLFMELCRQLAKHGGLRRIAALEEGFASAAEPGRLDATEVLSSLD